MSRYWDYFLQNGQPEKAPVYLGVQGYSIPLKRRLAQQFELTQSTGVEVQRVEPHSPAEEAGVLEGDVLLRVDKHLTPTADELFKLLPKLAIDIPVALLLLRGNRLLERLALPRVTPKKVQRA